MQPGVPQGSLRGSQLNSLQGCTVKRYGFCEEPVCSKITLSFLFHEPSLSAFLAAGLQHLASPKSRTVSEGINIQDTFFFFFFF